MQLEGSCHCGAVTFTVQSQHPAPFNVCYCSICRKTAGGSGAAINLSADFNTLEIAGKEHLSVYRAKIRTGDQVKESKMERSFCSKCGSALWGWHPSWPELLHPHASAIDTDLPTPPQRTHLMIGSKANWVEPCVADGDKTFQEYPDESIAQWHVRHQMLS